MVFAQIGVRQHIVADLLRMAQAAAMADHQPDLRAKHGEVVGDRLGIRRADTDIDQCDSRAVLRAQVIGRHLEPPPGRGFDRRAAVDFRHRNLQPSGYGQGLVARMPAELGQRPVAEGIDIAVIVREQNIVLEMLDRRAGIVLQTLQREIHPLRIEQRQRAHVIRLEQFAVGDLVADLRQLRRGKPAHQFGRRDLLEAGGLRGVPDIRIRNFRLRALDMHVHVIVAHQRRQLLDQVGAEKIRPRDGGHVNARLAHLAEGARNRRRGAIRIIDEADLRIAEGASGAGFAVRRRAIVQELVEGFGEGGNGFGVERFQRVHDSLR